MKITSLVLLFTALSTPALAETVRDHYKIVIEQNPYSVEVCQDVQQRGGGTVDTFFGALIGGALGNQVGNGSGKDVATVLGAIVGADVANKNANKSAGTQRQCRIETRYEEEQREVYSHSTVTFRADGKKYTLKFNK